VHGVHLKYVALSFVSAVCAVRCEGVAAFLLWYAAAVNAAAVVGFVTRRGMAVLGKDVLTGRVPLWSYVAWWPFHLPTWLYTAVHSSVSHGTPPASRVAPGWFIGGRYGDALKKKWAATIDLTAEFPERCIDATEFYLNLRCWDGQPPSPFQLEEAALFAATHRDQGDIMVHCAHGRGRSTCVMVACLVRAGVFENWQAAFEECKLHRPAVKLNKKMRDALGEWQATYGNAPFREPHRAHAEPAAVDANPSEGLRGRSESLAESLGGGLSRAAYSYEQH